MKGEEFEIRFAVFRVDRCAGFLGRTRAIGISHGTAVICFNADLMAGAVHAAAAVTRALRAVRSGSAISASLEMEALLSAAGSRQCSAAERFGIHEGENRAYVCLCPPVAAAWEELEAVMEFTEDPGTISGEKKKRLMEAFGITREELAAAGTDRITDLVLERVALLEVYR